MSGPDELFEILPVDGKPSPESIVIGPMSEVMEYIGGSNARNEKEQQIAQAVRDAEQTERHQQEVRECAAQILADGLTHLSERMDQFETRKQERADQLQRQAEAAEVARIETELAALPDPDNPLATGDDGDLEAIKPPPDTKKFDPNNPDPDAPASGDTAEGGDVSARTEAATGSMPKELDKGAPPQPGDYLSTTPPESPYRSPASIGLM
jgi:hypothetical protein